jgi:hypothetical protein
MTANSQKHLPFSSRNFALVNGEHMGSRMEKEKQLKNQHYE